MRRISVVLLLILLVSRATAIDFTLPLRDLHGEVITTEKDGKGEVLTLGKVASTALLLAFPDEQNLAGDEKLKRGVLALKVCNCEAGKAYDQVTLSAEDIALIKKLIAKGYGTLIVLRAWPLLDPGSIGQSSTQP
jgi:hypothetical protein